MKKSELRQIIREELNEAHGNGQKVFMETLRFMRAQIRKYNLNDDEVVELHDMLKKWANRGF